VATERKIVLITSNFPYYPGEQFLEEEVQCWSEFYSGSLIILPCSKRGIARELPENVLVDSSLTKPSSSFSIFFYRVRTLFSNIFLREVYYILRTYGVKYPKCFRIAFRTVCSTFTFYFKLKRSMKKLDKGVLIYCYWFDTASYASVLLKRTGKISHIISRAHGFDVYEERRPFFYMPLKRQFNKDFDKIIPISNQAKDYLTSTYCINPHDIHVSRLGVSVEKDMAMMGKDNSIAIVSVSACVPVKRIDKAIEAIALLSNQKPDLKIEWNHLGSGRDFNQLKLHAEKQFFNKSIKWKFHGQLANNEVRLFLKTNRVDLLLNTSESEGIPVSIMEAMSYGIPAIAPNVGGISELINSQNGILLSPDPNANEIANALSKIEFFRNVNVRRNAKDHIYMNFNSRHNYEKFIKHLESL
jgi:glycosyltransferase involved in cell wall biosynthesis